MSRIRELARLDQRRPCLEREPVGSGQGLSPPRPALWLAQAKGGAPAGKEDRRRTHLANTRDGPPATMESANDPKSQVILAKLEEPVSMPFADETTLEDVLKYIKQATTTEKYAGIPIYVDPIGLQEAEKSLTSTVKYMTLEGVPLRRTLQLLLKQLDLVYGVEDGLLYITSEESEDVTLGPSMYKASPMALKIRKAERYELTVEEMKEAIEYLRTRHQLLAMEEAADNPLAQPSRDPAPDDVKRLQDQISVLLKDMRELQETLKAASAGAKAAAPKSGGGLQ